MLAQQLRVTVHALRDLQAGGVDGGTNRVELRTQLQIESLDCSRELVNLPWGR